MLRCDGAARATIAADVPCVDGPIPDFALTVHKRSSHGVWWFPSGPH
jgi:hypothetical protein